MTEEQDHAASLRPRFAGEITEAERQSLLRICQRFADVTAGKAQFSLIAEDSARQLGELIRKHIDVKSLRNGESAHFLLLLNKAEPHVAPGLLDDEKSFARDIVGAIEFALNNGLGTTFIVNMLAHDLGQLLVYDGVAGIRDHCVLPKSCGYGDLAAEDAGDVGGEEG
jgi:hypothetical protein